MTAPPTIEAVELEKVYGDGMGSSYQFQGLTLSKQFKPYQG